MILFIQTFVKFRDSTDQHPTRRRYKTTLDCSRLNYVINTTLLDSLILFIRINMYADRVDVNY